MVLRHGAVAIVWVALSTLTGCLPDFDLERPLTLLAESGQWTADHRVVLGAAAESWNLEFGTRIAVAEQDPGGQVLPVTRGGFVCSVAGGVATRSEIHICNLNARQGLTLLEVAMHEIGHGLGIYSHAADPDAVMSVDDSRAANFSAEDRALFFGANPGFVGRGGCDVVNLVAEARSRPLLVHPPGGKLVLIWSEPKRLRFSELDRDGKLWGQGGEIVTASAALWIRPVPTKAGFALTFFEENRAYFVAVERQGDVLVALPKLRLALSVGDATNIDDVTTAHLGDDLYITTDRKVHRLDRRTGRRRPFAARLDDAKQVAVAPAGEALLVVRRLYSPDEHLQAVLCAPDGKVLHWIDLPVEGTGSSNRDFVGAWSGKDGVLIASQHRRDPLQFFLVEKQAGKVTLKASGQIRPQGIVRPPLAYVQRKRGRISMAITVGHIVKNFAGDGAGFEFPSEVFLTDIVVIGSELITSSPWRQLSTPDVTFSVVPSIGVVNGGTSLVTIWADAHTKGRRMVRSRCSR